MAKTESQLLRASRRHALLRTARSAALRAADWCEQRAFPEASSAAEHWQRVRLDEAVDEFVRSLGVEQLAAAEISGGNHAHRPWRTYQRLDYPDFDLCAPVTIEDRFDVVICEQVLEHVVDPCAATSNLRTLVRPGGHVVVTTPFLIKVHELLRYGMYDYWRFTPRGLQVLLERAGLEVLDVGAWGNRLCVMGNLSGWAAYRSWQPLRNEPDVPLQVWAFARQSS